MRAKSSSHQPTPCRRKRNRPRRQTASLADATFQAKYQCGGPLWARRIFLRSAQWRFNFQLKTAENEINLAEEQYGGGTMNKLPYTIGLLPLLVFLALPSAAADGPDSNFEISVTSILDTVGLIVAAIGIFLITRQLRQTRIVNEMAALTARYQTLFEMNRHLTQHPELVKFYVGGKRYERIRNCGPDQLKEVAQIDFMMDHIEFQFLSAYHHNRNHARSLVRSQFANPEVRRFWLSDQRGHFDSRFEKEVSLALKDIQAKATNK